MQFTLFAIAALASVASAQVQNLPPCAQACVTKFTTGDNIGGCPALQAACICSNPSFLSDIACCLAGACDVADQEKATQFAQQFCKVSGVTNLPTAVSCTSTATGSSTAASSTGSAATGTSGSSASTTPVASLTSSHSSSGTSSSTAAAATGNMGAQNVAGVGAGIMGGLAAVAALL